MSIVPPIAAAHRTQAKVDVDSWHIIDGVLEIVEPVALLVTIRTYIRRSHCTAKWKCTSDLESGAGEMYYLSTPPKRCRISPTARYPIMCKETGGPTARAREMGKEHVATIGVA